MSVPTTTDPAVAPYANAMLAKGHAAEAEGNISGARRYYMVAAQGGAGAAALALGRLYDPNILRGKTIGGIDPDAALARQWYARAEQLGVASNPSNNQSVSVK